MIEMETIKQYIFFLLKDPSIINGGVLKEKISPLNETIYLKFLNCTYC